MLTKLKYLKSYYHSYVFPTVVEYVKKTPIEGPSVVTTKYTFSKNMGLNTIAKNSCNYYAPFTDNTATLTANQVAPLNPIPFNSLGPTLTYSADVIPNAASGNGTLAFFYNGIQTACPVNDLLQISEWNNLLQTSSGTNYTQARIVDNKYVALIGGQPGPNFDMQFSSVEGLGFSDNAGTITSTAASNAFIGCAIYFLNFPALTSIGSGFCNNCANLKVINAPLATSIGLSAFQGCSSLKVANFPLATSVGNTAFRNCTSLTTINLDSCTSLGTNVFQGITGKTLTLRIKASLSANANVTTLTGANTVTLILT